MEEQTIDRAKSDADRVAPIAAEAEANYKSLVREEKIVFSKCILKHRSEAKNLEILKALAHADEDYVEHKKKIDTAHELYLRADKIFTSLIEWIKLATSWNYMMNSRFKAGA